VSHKHVLVSVMLYQFTVLSLNHCNEPQTRATNGQYCRQLTKTAGWTANITSNSHLRQLVEQPVLQVYLTKDSSSNGQYYR